MNVILKNTEKSLTLKVLKIDLLNKTKKIIKTMASGKTRAKIKSTTRGRGVTIDGLLPEEDFFILEDLEKSSFSFETPNIKFDKAIINSDISAIKTEYEGKLYYENITFQVMEVL